MHYSHHDRKSRPPVRRISTALLIIALGALLLLSSLSPAAHAAPALLQLAATNPDAQVAVIVQQTSKDVDLTGWVMRSGGSVTHDLSIVNAFSAELPARLAAQLAVVPGVRWISLDSMVEKSGCKDCDIKLYGDPSSYLDAIGATKEPAKGLTGKGVTVAVVDSGIDNDLDLANGQSKQSRIIARARIKDEPKGWFDHYGHGTFVAGVIGGNGKQSKGEYVGGAPGVNLVGVQVTDDKGAGMTSDVVAGLQWVYENKDRYNIRVVNISLNSSVYEPYYESPLDAAVEILWFNKIVVVVSAGNTGPNGEIYAPANDPFVITVGAVNSKGTADRADDVLAGYSGYGELMGASPESGSPQPYYKPDIVAPGNNIISLLASEGSTLARAHRDHVVNSSYFRMSGTSVSSAVVSGAVALLLQHEPELNPDQVKYRLLHTATPFGPGTGHGYLNIDAAIDSDSEETENTGTLVSPLLFTGPNPPVWGDVSWTSVSWTSVSWTSVSWTSVSWTSVSWTSVSWTSVAWTSVAWTSVCWTSDYWDE